MLGKVKINAMLEDGFSADSYSAILGNLKDNGHLDDSDVENLIHGYIIGQKIVFDGVCGEKAKIVSEALIDNYHRQKHK